MSKKTTILIYTLSFMLWSFVAWGKVINHELDNYISDLPYINTTSHVILLVNEYMYQNMIADDAHDIYVYLKSNKGYNFLYNHVKNVMIKYDVMLFADLPNEGQREIFDELLTNLKEEGLYPDD